MRNLWREIVGLIVCLMISPVLALAVPQTMAVAPCECGPVTPQSYTYNFSAEAQRLLDQAKQDSYLVQNYVATLEGMDGDPYTNDWHMDTYELGHAADIVQRLDKIECRLRNIERATTPQQQAVIKRVVPEIVILTDNMNRTMQYVNHNQHYLWNPQYVARARQMYRSTERIDNYLRYPNQYMVQSRVPNQTLKGSQS